MEQPKILAFAGSARTGSFNKKLIPIAAEAAKRAGAQVTVIDLKDYPMPLYDGDLEEREGLPAVAVKLKELFIAHQGLLIASPEYNSGISPLLKNTIDWVSRQASDDEPPLACYRGKVATLMSASPGGLGGLRGLVHVRSILGNIGVLVLPDQIALPKAHEAFNADGSLKDARMAEGIQKLGAGLAEILKKLK